MSIPCSMHPEWLCSLLRQLLLDPLEHLSSMGPQVTPLNNFFLLLSRVMWATLVSPEHQDPR